MLPFYQWSDGAAGGCDGLFDSSAKGVVQDPDWVRLDPVSRTGVGFAAVGERGDEHGSTRSIDADDPPYRDVIVEIDLDWASGSGKFTQS
ncbi:hypothetical protein [Nocardia nova]|uniref:hypothetical protein n=1 Tax=Nocardia nova TaxID=37330 RepID=UPI001CA4C26D|nr:hypothetical protein [Nocardia nova]